jgi:hypothetical protein
MNRIEKFQSNSFEKKNKNYSYQRRVSLSELQHKRILSFQDYYIL